MQASRIDHVHVEVSDRAASAAWYERVLGLKRHAPLASWEEDPMGPLILEDSDVHPTLSLFVREFKDTSRDATVAFRVTGNDFLEFRASLESWN